MKDPGGHGSNSKLTSKQGPAPALPARGGRGTPIQIHGGAPMSSNSQAAQALMASLKSTQAPIHPAHLARRSANSGSSS